MNKKIVPIILIIAGAAFLLGSLAFFLDSLTSAQPKGLGEQILNALGLLLGAGASLAGIIGLFKKEEKPASAEVQQNIKDMRGGTVIGKVETLNLPQPVPETHDTIGFIQPANVVTYVHRGKIEDDVRNFLKNGGTLKNAGRAGAIVGLHAPGGLGKTELAKHAAEEMKDQFEGILWADVGEKKPQQVIGDLLLKLGVSVPPGTSEEQQKNELHHALQNRRLLIVFDDVREKALAGLNDFLPPQPCSALLTSRIQQIGGVNKTFELDHMTPAQAKELMEAVLGEEVVKEEGEAAAKLAERCAFNPLAVEIAARRIRQMQGARRPIAQYFEMAQARFNLLKMEGDKRWDMNYIFDLSYDNLSAEDQSRFRSLAAFHPTGFAPQAASFLWGDEEIETRNALMRFINLSLVKPVPTEIELERFRLHDLLDEYAQNKLPKIEEAGTRNKLAQWIIALFTEYYTDDKTTAPQAFAERANLLRACEWARGQKNGNLLAQLITQSRNWFMVSFVEDWISWIAWLETSLKLGIDDKDKEGKQLKANVLQAIGDVQQFRDDRDAALKSYEQALALFREIGAKLGEANVLSELAKLTLITGDMVSAEKQTEEVAAIYRGINAIYSAGACYGNFSIALLNLGNKIKAKEYALDMWRN